MAMLDEIKKISEEYKAKFKENKGIYDFVTVIAERKAFLSTKKLEYIAKFRIDEETKTLKFTEMLKESGSGLSMGGGYDNDMTPGFGFKTSTYKTGMGPREESIEEQSKLFGKDFTYKFDFKEIRNKFETAAKDSGYSFKYQITPIGL